jgi:hypothetical protein
MLSCFLGNFRQGNGFYPNRSGSEAEFQASSPPKTLEDFLMQLLRSARWLLLALIVLLIPVSSQAGIFISVGIAPPPLPVYVQPPCPGPDLMWTPGYWAYGDDGYYWVPGTWVAAPQPGFLWTPHYWGWEGGHYIFHEGYWGPHIGFYGGVNYGFGYGGIGFAGGEWRGGHFAYNTAVVNVNRTVIHNTYVNTTIVHNTTIVNNNHAAFSGGPGGVQHQPTAEERAAEHEQHTAPTSFQQQHAQTARADKTSYAKNNGGHPANAAVSRPLGNNGAHPAAAEARPAQNAAHGSTPAAQSHSASPQMHTASQPAHQSAPAEHNAAPASHPAPAMRQAPQQHSAPPSHAAPASHPAPQQHSAPRQESKHK